MDFFPRERIQSWITVVVLSPFGLEGAKYSEFLDFNALSTPQGPLKMRRVECSHCHLSM